MKIRHVSTIVFVSDVARSTTFYRDVLEQPVSQDFDTIVSNPRHSAWKA